MQPKLSVRQTGFLVFGLLGIAGLFLFATPLLRTIGSLIVVDDPPAASDAIVILNTGIEYYPRLIQAADIYRRHLVRKVVINGNRKTDTLRDLEKQGFERCCPWYTDSVRILTLLDVPEDDIVKISAENAYDTISEARIVGRELIQRQFKRVIITTSKSHTRRARYIWQNMYENELVVRMTAAKSDPYDPQKWWRDGRQIRWVLAEYGAWIYYWLKTPTGD
jgi:uncharacterized SAM-binding protein YcdF (DUF218 family)